MLGINREHAEQIYGTYLQYADHIQCIHRAALPIRVNNGGKEIKWARTTTTNRRQKRPVPRAAAAYGRQLKKLFSYVKVLSYQ